MRAKLAMATVLLVLLLLAVSIGPLESFALKATPATIMPATIMSAAVKPAANHPDNFNPQAFKGFNLLSKQLNDAWVSDDAQHWSFQFMQQHGFNFARIPMEIHRLYTDDSYTKLRPEALQELDRIVRLGQRYNVHILLDLHSLPGMRVVDRPEEVKQWSSAAMKARRIKLHVQLFSTLTQRYRHLGPEALSFNLLNEPHNLSAAEYLERVLPAYRAIRAIDKDRPVFFDGLDYSSRVVDRGLPLEDPFVVLSPHMYEPYRVTHYKAEWGGDAAMHFPVPQYPSLSLNSFIYGHYHQTLQSPLTIDFGDTPLPTGSQVTVVVDVVSGETVLSLKGDEKSLIEKRYRSGPGSGEWKTVQYNKDYDVYQNIYDQRLTVTLKAPVRRLTLSAPEGDWFTYSEIVVSLPAAKSATATQTLKPTSGDWGRKPAEGPVYIRVSNGLEVDYKRTKSVLNAETLYNQYMLPWVKQSQASGRPLVYAEFGVYQHTPHEVALALLADQIENFRRAKAGWALWNLSGPFGIFDSGRVDVSYNKTKYPGRALDERMLKVLMQP